MPGFQLGTRLAVIGSGAERAELEYQLVRVFLGEFRQLECLRTYRLSYS